MDKESDFHRQKEDDKDGRLGVLIWLVWLLIFPSCLCLTSQLAAAGPRSRTVALGAGGPGPDYSAGEVVQKHKPLSHRIIEEIIADQVREEFAVAPSEEQLAAIVAERAGQVPAAPPPAATSPPEATPVPETSPTPGESATLPPDASVTAAPTEPALSPSPVPTSMDTQTPGPTGTPRLTETPTPTSPPGSTPTHTPTAPAAATSTYTPTPTSVPHTPTNTPMPPTPTYTPVPPTPTNTPPPAEVVEIFLTQYDATRQRLTVKARTNLPECTLTLAGFGPMEPQGGHWRYMEENLGEGNAPSTITVASSCGGSDTSAVQWK